MSPGTIVIGIGNPWRGDDAAGIEVVRRLAAMGTQAPRAVVHQRDDPSRLLELWRGVDSAIVVDAAASGGLAGEIQHFDAVRAPLPAPSKTTFGHGLGVAEAIELARALNRLPSSLLVFAIEGDNFELGSGLTPAVRRAVSRLVDELMLGAAIP